MATITAENDTSEGHALRTGEPMISPDIATETRFKYSDFLIDNSVRAVANVLIIGGQGKPPFGILQIDSRVPRQFTLAGISSSLGLMRMRTAQGRTTEIGRYIEIAMTQWIARRR